MRFIDYQSNAASTCVSQCFCGEYLRPGLLNEAGEISGQIKRVARGDITIDEARPLIAKELGDALWYSSMWALLKGVNTDGVNLGNFLIHPRRSELGHLEDVAFDIHTDACIFRMAATRTQLTALLRRLEILANAIGFTMRQIADLNSAKLQSRRDRNMIQGVGDAR